MIRMDNLVRMHSPDDYIYLDRVSLCATFTLTTFVQLLMQKGKKGKVSGIFLDGEWG